MDAILGTGFAGQLRSLQRMGIETINGSPAQVLAVDLPSGLECNSGQPSQPTVEADITCTFVAPKRGFSNPLAQPLLGEVKIVDIGLPLSFVERVLE